MRKVKIGDFVKAFKALGEPTRLKILKMLSLRPLCVCELSEVLNIAQPRVSQHLRILKEADLVRESRESYWVIYSLNHKKMESLLEDFSEYIISGEADSGNSEMASEISRLASLKGRERKGRI